MLLIIILILFSNFVACDLQAQLQKSYFFRNNLFTSYYVSDFRNFTLILFNHFKPIQEQFLREELNLTMNQQSVIYSKLNYLKKNEFDSNGHELIKLKLPGGSFLNEIFTKKIISNKNELEKFKDASQKELKRLHHMNIVHGDLDFGSILFQYELTQNSPLLKMDNVQASFIHFWKGKICLSRKKCELDFKKDEQDLDFMFNVWSEILTE